jgi:hypothetical protein
LDRNLCVPDYHNFEKGTKFATIATPNFTDFEPVTIRKNTYISSTKPKKLQKQ